ncbi:MAG: SIS domain-containing protein [Kineosporiaceae bacterium]
MIDESDESVLDDPEALAERDPGGMLRALASAGAQVREAVLRTGEAPLASVVAEGRPRAVLVAGMGGSGISADVAAAVAGVACPVPVTAHRGYRLPGWVGPMDLVVAVSCSGRTEETLAVADEALRRGCRLVTVGEARSPLASRAEAGHGVHLPVDAGGRMPRANLWALSVPVLLLLDALGLASVPAGVLAEVADDLDRMSARCAPSSESYENPAKRLALELAGSLPYLWGTSEVAGVAAYRLACQLAENAKYPAVHGVLPEAQHNQVVAFCGPFGSAAPGAADDDLFRDRVEDGPGWPRMRVLLLRDTEEVPQVARRREATRRLAEQYGVAADEIPASGTHPVARLASLVAPTDFASVYLALLQGIDPTPIDPIVSLKEQIAR